MCTETKKQSLYEQDFYNWLQQTARLLQEGKFHELDINNLVEEIQAMGRSERRAIRSNLVILLMHLLKWYYQSGHRSNSWRYTILEHRKRLDRYLTDSPSLKPYCLEIFSECYQDARQAAAAETGLALEQFPSTLPFTIEQVLNSDFLPNEQS